MGSTLQDGHWGVAAPAARGRNPDRARFRNFAGRGLWCKTTPAALATRSGADQDRARHHALTETLSGCRDARMYAGTGYTFQCARRGASNTLGGIRWRGAHRARGNTRSSCRVDAGFAVWFDRNRCVIAPKPTEQLTGWSRGLLVINAEPLGQVLEELGRYRHGVLRCDPSVAHLLVSGVFPLAHVDQSLDMITQTHGLAIERRAKGWWTTVVPK